MQVNVPGVEFLRTPPRFVSRREISHYVHAVTARGKKRATGAKTVVLLVEHISFSGFLITIRNVILQN